MSTLTATQATDAGIAKAARSAGQEWQDMALAFLRWFLDVLQESEGPQAEFMAERVRYFAYTLDCPHPPAERAWGQVRREAQRRGLVEFVGYRQVSNPRAHRANAGVWRRKA